MAIGGDIMDTEETRAVELTHYEAHLLVYAAQERTNQHHDLNDPAVAEMVAAYDSAIAKLEAALGPFIALA